MIRPFTRQDDHKLAHIPFFGTDFIYDDTNEDCTIVYQRSPRGLILGALDYWIERGGYGDIEILALGVRTKYRRKGIGRELVRYVEKIARNKKKSIVLSSVRGSMGFYKRLGYKDPYGVGYFNKRFKRRGR